MEMEKQVRLLLHRARKPEELAKHPLARALCTALDVTDPVQALRKVVEDAFSDGDEEDVRLRSLVIRCDLEGSASLNDLCTEFAYSRRHFQRYRAQAVTAIARHLHKVLDPAAIDAPHRSPLEALAAIVADREPGAATKIYELASTTGHARAELAELQARLASGAEIAMDDLSAFTYLPKPLAYTLAAQSQEIAGKSAAASALLSHVHFTTQEVGSFDTATAFELEWLHLLRALHQHDAHTVAAHARALDRLATDRPHWRQRAVTACALAGLMQGEFAEAENLARTAVRIGSQTSDLRGLADATLVEAELAFVNGDTETSKRLTVGAAIAFEHRPREAHICAALLGRIAFVTADAWELPSSVTERHPAAWDRMWIEGIAVRHAGNAAAAESTYHRAMELGYRGIAAYHAATRASLCTPHTPEMHEWIVRALAAFVTTQDHSLGYDLFTRELHDVELVQRLHAELAEMLFERLAALAPHFRSEGASQRATARRLLAAIVAHAVDQLSKSALEEAALLAKREQTALAQYAARAPRQFERSLALTLSTLIAPAERPALRARLHESTRVVLRTLRPNALTV